MRPADQTEYIVQCIREAGSMYEDDARRFLAEHDGYARTAVLAEAKHEVVAWLVKKAREKRTWDVGVLASKVDRGAVRTFLGTGHYRDAVDAHRAEVLAEAAEFVGNDDDCDCGGCGTCIPRRLADGLRAMAAGEKTTPSGATATPDELSRLRAFAEATERRHAEVRALLSRVEITGSGEAWDLGMSVLALLDGPLPRANEEAAR